MRLVTKSSFDSLVCAMILKEAGAIDGVKFLHPRDIQKGKIDLTENDVIVNLPYNERVHLCFDHQGSENENPPSGVDNYITDEDAKSTARVVYNYYKKDNPLSRITDEIMTAVDKCESADFTLDEILNASGWVLLNFILDARTGLGRFHDFTISNYDLMMKLIDFCPEHSISEILSLPDVKERIDLYYDQQDLFKEQLERVARVKGNCVVIDLRNEDTIYVGNRFYVYALFPQAQYSIHVVRGFKNINTAITIGKSIINKAGVSNIGDLCLKYDGEGHENAGTCQVDNDKADTILPYIINALGEQ